MCSPGCVQDVPDGPETSPAPDGRTVRIVDRVGEGVRRKGLFRKELKAGGAVADEPVG
ncbi:MULTISPECIES: hypothetical protein [unclassified Streptomyces]|uniref:hypothetical protein n=1 Tax=unclassified Streptomyces TaxID=2593676 RepID=UPI00073C88AC|nr:MULTISPECIES: hypothetical protein [unclassified Streptomyces]ODA70066.1 hypothetical protein APS67_005767 [Streptomyces sp. AVP053U2]